MVATKNKLTEKVQLYDNAPPTTTTTYVRIEGIFE